MARKGKARRKTRETDITVEIELDGWGRASIETGIPFFDHMLDSLCRHGLFNLRIKARGDIEVDYHHTVEDTGLVLGQAVAEALGDKEGIQRFGQAKVPMMDALAEVVADIGGRPHLEYRVRLPRRRPKTDEGMPPLNATLVEEFLRAFSSTLGADIHVILHYGRDLHHSIEAIFKALARALMEATRKNTRIKGVLSTKGCLR